MKQLVLVVACSLAVPTAFAQTPASLLGSWDASWQANRRMGEARLVLTSTGGTWKSLGSSREDNACAGKEAPVSVESQKDDQAVITLKFSEVLSGCQDSKVTVRLTSPDTMTGTRGDREITFKKK